MPTPSSNPPPALPPRSHSSSCPDEWRASATSSSSWQTAAAVAHGDDSDEQEESSSMMHVDGAASGEDTIMSPGSSTSHQVTIDDDEIDSRSNTESPRSDSRSGVGTAETTPAPEQHHHHHNHHHLASGALPSSSTKTADDDTEDDHETPRRSRRDRDQVLDAQKRDSATTSFDSMTPSTIADCDKAEASSSTMSSRLQHDYCNPPMGYDFSNARVRSPSLVYPTTSPVLSRSHRQA